MPAMREIRAPSAKPRDLFRAGHCIRFAEEAANARSVLELHAADAERSRNGGHESTEARGGYRPHFDFDACPAGGDANEPRTRRRTAGQRVEAIARCRACAAHELRAEIAELRV